MEGAREEIGGEQGSVEREKKERGFCACVFV